uniref:Uncharacterized protein n=1 Tax=Riptortus pedestris TaxID=329032 RepID=R4WDA7_RIPPE|nr:unknown secreted protein [Riptortus pedestris]
MNLFSQFLLLAISAYESQGHAVPLTPNGDVESTKLENYIAIGEVTGGFIDPFKPISTNPPSFDYQFNLNGFFDYIIKSMKFLLEESGKLSISLPDVARSFRRGLIKGRLTASQGYFRNIASLERTADAEMRMNGSKIYLSAAFGLREFTAGFQNYSFELGEIYQSGEMRFSVGNNSVGVVLSYDLFHLCSLKVESVELSRLEGIQIEVGGLGDFQHLVRILTRWIIHSFSRTFRNTISSQMEKNINTAIAHYMKTFCMFNYTKI